VPSSPSPVAAGKGPLTGAALFELPLLTPPDIAAEKRAKELEKKKKRSRKPTAKEEDDYEEDEQPKKKKKQRGIQAKAPGKKGNTKRAGRSGMYPAARNDVWS